MIECRVPELNGRLRYLKTTSSEAANSALAASGKTTKLVHIDVRTPAVCRHCNADHSHTERHV
jgi:hypothetical protein